MDLIKIITGILKNIKNLTKLFYILLKIKDPITLL